MKLKIIVTLVAAMGILGRRVEAQIYDTNNDVVQTFVGSAFQGYLDGQGMQTMFNEPLAIAADTSSNLFVIDYSNPVRIRKITPDGTVTTFAGGGGNALPGYGTNVSLPFAITMTIDHSNTLYLMNYSSGTSMLRVGSDGYVTSISLSGLSGGSGSRDGLCVDSGNNVYISDTQGNKIWRYRTNGILEVFAGSGNSGSLDGNGVFTSFSNLSALAADNADNIYVCDANKLIRKINQNRDVVTIAGNQSGTDSDGAGTNASFYLVSGICADGFGNLYLACFSGTGGESIRKMTAATNVTTLAGNFTQHGYANGIGSLARFNGGGDEGICVSQGIIFLADAFNYRIRQISFNPSSQVVSPANLQLNTYPGLQIIGTVGRTYQIQTSPDLNSWSTKATILLNSSPYIWIDQNPVSGNKFYRAVLLP
jgi:hypothetical protein